MTRQELAVREAIERRIAANLIYDARLKEREAAVWLNLPGNIEEAAANVHSALDAVLDAIAAQIRAAREQHGSAA